MGMMAYSHKNQRIIQNQSQLYKSQGDLGNKLGYTDSVLEKGLFRIWFNSDGTWAKQNVAALCYRRAARVCITNHLTHLCLGVICLR